MCLFVAVVAGNWKVVLDPNVMVARGNVAPFICKVEENSRDFLSVSGWSSSTSFTPIQISIGNDNNNNNSPLPSTSKNPQGFLPIVHGSRYAFYAIPFITPFIQFQFQFQFPFIEKNEGENYELRENKKEYG